MKKIILFTGLFCFASIAFHLQAQSITNKNWKVYMAEPFSDTLTIHMQSDSSFVTKSDGEVLVRSTFKIEGNTITLLDYEGQYMCKDQNGKYKFTLKADTVVFTLIDDPCEGRTRALDGATWTTASK
jgi:hypothetical protein